MPGYPGTVSPDDLTARAARFKDLTMSFLMEKPVFIMAAPRSGSTLLFETLSASPAVWTIGGEGHHIIEGIPELRPGAPGVTSNRLTEQHASDDVVSGLYQRFLQELRNVDGNRLLDSEFSGSVRMLEKTPKNALRIPLINRVFPDAFYIYLYRDPRENMGSIIDAWLSGRWVTYRGLPGWNGPWSLLLPPDWRRMAGKSLAEVAAFQWESANRYILDDLSQLPADRWVAVDYADLLRAPGAEVERICNAIQLPFDDALRERTAHELPLSRYTLTAPRPDKWRRYESEILSVLPAVMPLWGRITEACAGHGAEAG